MSKKTLAASPEEPLIRFGGRWLPAHEAWKKLQTANVVADQIERFNANFPALASHRTRDVVPLVRQRLRDIELRIPRVPDAPDIGTLAAQLLATHSPDVALDILAREHDVRLSIHQLIQSAREAYQCAIQREANDFKRNRISPEQIAQLWNELGRPVPGGGLWTAQKVAGLLD